MRYRIFDGCSERAALLLVGGLLASCDRAREDVERPAAGSSAASSTAAAIAVAPPAPAAAAGGGGFVERIDPGPSAAADETDEEGLRSVEAVALSPTSVEIAWRTAELSDSVLLAGEDAGLGLRRIWQPEPSRRHLVVLTGLEPATVYFFQASSTSDGRSLTSEVRSIATPAVEPYRVLDSHPRIFFTGADLPELRRRIEGSHAAYWRKLKAWCDSVLDAGTSSMAEGDNGPLYVRALAFAGLVGDDAACRRKAQELALHSASLALSDNYPVRRSILIMAAVYDGLFESLDATSRATLRAAILERLQTLSTNDREWIWGWNPETFSPMTVGALAIAGDAPEAKEILDRCVYRYRHSILSSWRHYARHGGSLEGWWYSAFHLDMFIDAFEGLRTAAGLNFYESEPWLNRAVDWFLIGLRADDSFHRVGDSKIFNGLHYSNRRFAQLAARMYGNEQAQWLGRRIEDAIGVWGPTAVSDILLLDPTVKATEPAPPSSRCFPEAGFVFAQDSWGPDAVQVMFRSASDFTMGHTHRDNNSFTIFYRAGLALDSGLYDDFNSDHHRSYYERTIAHNTILVDDPDEVFRRYSAVVAADGGQRYLLAPEDAPNVMPGSVEEILDPSKGYQAGGILFYESTPQYTYAMGDAAFSYSPDKLSAFDRHFLFLRGVEGFAKPVMIIFDRVVSTQASFKKTYLLHTQERPQVMGALVWAANKAGMLYQQTVLPAPAEIEVVGGPGKEFWVDGANHPPVKPPQELDEAGQYRVEVSPGSARTADHFLHVLYATDAGSPAPPLARGIAAESMKGLEVGDRIALFPAAGGQVTSVTYSAEGRKIHLLVGLVPLAVYEVLLDGRQAQLLKATYEGTLLFGTDGAVVIDVRKAPPGSA